jgi:hypothetical protein
MIFKLRMLLLLAMLLAAAPAVAQVTPVQKDTIKEKRDKMYKNIETFSKKKKFTKFLYKLIFRPVREKEPASTRKRTRRKTPEMISAYAAYEGKIIRRINIETLDPFGYSITDTAARPSNWVQRFGNSIHLKTKNLAIKNFLLFKRNQPLDSIRVKESERLLRTQRYIRRVVITPEAIKGSKDSVDINIRVLDSWSLIPNGSFSGSGTSIEVTERNFFGFGHELRNDFDKRFNTGETAYLARYRVPNIMNTYINAELNYQILMTESSLKSIGFQRDFFSPLTQWAGGVYFEQRLVRDSLPDLNGLYAMQNMKSDQQDYWLGRAFKIFKGRTLEDRTTNLVITTRFVNTDFKEMPAIEYDPIGYYRDERFYLGSIGITSRKFVQDKFLFNYDVVEDIPIGKVYSFTGGVNSKNGNNRLYLGGRYGFGNYYKWGFFSVNTELGTFLNSGNMEQTVLRLESLYFTNITEWGRWRFRHFIKPSLVIGDNRLNFIRDRLNLNGDFGIAGFDSPTLIGTQKFILTLQTQSYSPWDVVGFRISPFANVTLGMIGDDNNRIYESDIYTKIGLGVLLTNDYLIFNGFQISIAFYPDIPGIGSNIFKNNTFRNSDIILPDFQIGKPSVVPYQ